MLKFLIKRIVFGFFVLIGAIVVTFFIFQVLPGDASTILLPKKGTPEDIARIKHNLGLDQDKGTQLVCYLRDLSPISTMELSEENQKEYEYSVLLPLGDNTGLVYKAPYLRRSQVTQKRVSELIGEKIMSTFWLAITAMLIATILGITMGVISAVNHNTFTDHFMVILSVVGISVPSFVAGALIGLIFAVMLHDVTGLNASGGLWEPSFYGPQLILKNLLLPAITLGIRPLSIIVQLTRSSMLDVLSSDYIRTAKAKGLSHRKVVFKHALKNALNPVITAVSGWVAALMAGAFFVEIIFDYKGIGWMTVKAVESNDFPVVMGVVIVVAVIFIIVNILVDILYAITDPRVRLK